MTFNVSRNSGTHWSLIEFVRHVKQNHVLVCLCLNTPKTRLSLPPMVISRILTTFNLNLTNMILKPRTLLDEIDYYFNTVTDEQLEADLKAANFDYYNSIGIDIIAPFMIIHNLPTVHITDQETDPGWRRVGIGETVKTYYQVYSFFPIIGWKICSYWTNENFVNKGVSNYRQPVSIKAWLTVFPQLMRKQWRHLTKQDR